MTAPAEHLKIVQSSSKTIDYVVDVALVNFKDDEKNYLSIQAQREIFKEIMDFAKSMGVVESCIDDIASNKCLSDSTEDHFNLYSIKQQDLYFNDINRSYSEITNYSNAPFMIHRDYPELSKKIEEEKKLSRQLYSLVDEVVVFRFVLSEEGLTLLSSLDLNGFIHTKKEINGEYGVVMPEKEISLDEYFLPNTELTIIPQFLLEMHL